MLRPVIDRLLKTRLRKPMVIGLLSVALIGMGPTAAVADSKPPATVSEDAEALNDPEILATLGNGVTYEFTGLKTPITGTSNWDPETGVAYGTFVWDGKIRGTWNHKWFVREAKSCLVFSPQRTVCERIYRHGSGFMEMDEDGAVHTVSMPMQAPTLANDLTVAEVEHMLSQMLEWLETPGVEIGDVVLADGNRLIATAVNKDGSPAWKLEVNRRTGVMRGIP